MLLWLDRKEYKKIVMDYQQRTSLQDKVAIVTGASSGIGEAVARLLLQRGARVVLFARRTDKLQELAQKAVAEGYTEPLLVAGDVRNPEEVEGAVQKALERWGRLDIVIANAGFGYRAPLVDGDIQRWKEMLDTNVYGLLLTLKYGVAPLLKQGHGHVIVTSSIAGRSVNPGGSAYSASKYAVNAIAEGLRQEVAPQGVRVTNIAPGSVTTGFATVAGYSDEVRAALQRLQPLTSEDVANAMIYALEQPAHVDVSEMVVYPTRQVNQGAVTVNQQ